MIRWLRTFLTLSALLSLVAIPAALADLPPLIPRSTLYGNAERFNPIISPDGKRLVYIAPDHGVLNAWVRTVGKKDDRVVTSETRRGIQSRVGWQADSRHLFYTQDVDGDEIFHVYQCDTQTNETRDLTPWRGVRAALVSTRPQVPDRILVSMNLRDRNVDDIYRIDLRSGAVQLDTRNPKNFTSWTVDNAMNVRAGIQQRPDGGSELYVRNRATSSWRVLESCGPLDTLEPFDFTADNRRLLVGSTVGANTKRLVEYDLSANTRRVIAEDQLYDITFTIIHPRTGATQAALFLRSRAEWKVLDPKVAPDFEAIRRVRDGDFIVVSRDLADKRWTVAFFTDNGPTYFYLYDHADRKASLLFSNRPALERFQLARTKPISLRTRDGMTIYGYLTLPEGIEAHNLPTVMLVHGGPWSRDEWGFNSEVQQLANRGYAVLQVNFRGSSGYGKAYMNSGNREWAGKMQTDLLDAKQWVVEKGFTDPSRVAIMGASYGGYAALVGLAFTPSEFACGIDLCGPSNLVTLLKSIPPWWTPIKAMFEQRVGNVQREPEFLVSRSPLPRAGNITAPLLICQGANDPRVKQAEADQIVTAMRAHGKPVEYLLFPNEGHGLSHAENKLKFSAACEEFLAKHLGGRLAPLAPEERYDEFRK